MANNPISMSKIRQILKLHFQHMGKRKIGERLGMPKNTVRLYIEQFQKLKRTWDELSRLTDYELNKLFHPPKLLIQTDRLKHLHDFFPELEKQLRRRGMTVSKQYEQYRLLLPDGYGLTVFFFYFNHWRKILFIDKNESVLYRNSESSSGEVLKEREANSFAAALLMPKKTVEFELSIMPTHSDVIGYLSERFKVSSQAMSFRLSNLGYDFGLF